MLRRPLQQPYDGPFKVLQRKDKVFLLDINGKRVSVSIDRCKPAFFLNTEDLQLPQTKNETPATVEPNATASTPATVESDPTASTPTQPSTRSGRKVHLPTSDEAHFWLNGYVNKQNCRIWSEANPQVYVETPLHPEKLTVWCALWAGGIIGPYFFKNDEGHNVTVNGDRYRTMITNFFIPELNNHDVQELWFQEDGATCHTARATIDLSKDTFGDRLISRFGPVNWPPRSCDLTPLDYFLWGYVKSLVYADKPQTLDHLEDNIRRVIADIRP
ncbi:putative transposable element [Trichonephila clavipes]|nr:putative transposable element [Trichonephila clavipes]